MDEIAELSSFASSVSTRRYTKTSRKAQDQEDSLRYFFWKTPTRRMKALLSCDLTKEE